MGAKRTVDERVRLDEKALLDRNELSQYLSIGLNNANEVGIQANAIVRIGKTRVLYRREAIDDYLEEISE